MVDVEQREFVKEEARFVQHFMNSVDLLIPIPHPLAGLLVIGNDRVTYLGDHTSTEIQIEPVSRQSFLLNYIGFLFFARTFTWRL